MKKLIIVVMALITIFSASVTAHAEVYVDWQVVDTITNIVYDSYNCCLTFHNTASPTPTMTNASGARGTQKTTYDVLYSLYETVSVNGASFQANVILGGVFEWYEYGGYCWIKYDIDNSTNTFWVANKQGKILYCDAPTTSSSYTISAIAGASNYYLTDRPVNTTGSGYAGDMRLVYNSWLNIKSALNNLSGSNSYYTYGHSIDGEFRYYLAYRPGTKTYYVCNNAGRLFYTIKEEPSSGGSGDGSTFDDSEIIAALNSVYDALDYGFYDVCDWLDAIQDNITSFNKDVQVLSQNVTSGFIDLKDIGTDIFTKLVGIETLLDVRLTSIKDDLWYIHGATAGLNSHFYDFAQVWEYKSETIKELINGVEPNLISISSNIQTYLPRLDSSVDEVKSKLTSLESTITSQHETIVDYWDMLQQGITSWGDMELYALYGFSPLGNEYPDSYLKKIYDVLYSWYALDADSGIVGLYLQLWGNFVEDVIMKLDYILAELGSTTNRNDSVFSEMNKLNENFESLEATITSQHEDIVDYWALLENGLDGWGKAQMMYLEGYFEMLDYLFAKKDNLGDVVASYPKLTYDSVDGLETTLSNIYDRLGDIEDAVVSADNVIIDITTDNDAFNIFYITKTDGTTESVGDAAKDAAKVVGEFLSIFYRLVFDDALSNADIIHDFEEVYTVNDSGVSVW